MYGAMLLFESEFVHIVAISFTSLILTELLMVALTIQTWHWLMIVAELLSLASYIASLVFLHEFIGKLTRSHTDAFIRQRVTFRLKRCLIHGEAKESAFISELISLQCYFVFFADLEIVRQQYREPRSFILCL